MRSDDVDLLVIGGRVITVDADRQVFENAAVLIRDGLIVEIAAADDALAANPQARVIGGTDRVLTPGYVNCHQHLTGDRLMASAIPDDLQPGAAIVDWVLPGHAAHRAEDDEVSATVGCIAALRNGITTTVEAGTVAHPEAVGVAMSRVGMRGTVGTWGWDSPGQPFAGTVDEVLEQQRLVLERWPLGGLVEGRVTLVGHDLMSDDLMTGACALAKSSGAGITFHMSPSTADPISYVERTGVRPLVHLQHLGVLGSWLLLAHAVHLDDEEVDLVVETDTAIAYTPWAYLRLGQGVATAGRHAEMWQRGARVGLGCDSENAGDAVDGLRAAALAAGLAKEQLGDPTAFGAHDALEMLTIGGARAIGAADRIGSIEPGKSADLVVHRTDGPQWQPPSADPVLQLVWSSDGRSVSDVIVDGDVVVADSQCTTVDESEWFAMAADAAEQLFRRAGIAPPSRWPAVDPGGTRG